MTVIRDAIGIFALTFCGGFAIGVAKVFAKLPDDTYFLLIAICNLILCTIGFTVSASLSRHERWKHITLVAVCVWAMGIVNILVGISVLQWVLGLFFILFTMAIGGALSYLFAGTQQTKCETSL